MPDGGRSRRDAGRARAQRDRTEAHGLLERPHRAAPARRTRWPRGAPRRHRRQRPEQGARGSELAEILYCIRCGACLYACPVYQQIGGHAYGSVYSGPVGAVLTPALRGLDANSTTCRRRAACAAPAARSVRCASTFRGCCSRCGGRRSSRAIRRCGWRSACRRSAGRRGGPRSSRPAGRLAAALGGLGGARWLDEVDARATRGVDEDARLPRACCRNRSPRAGDAAPAADDDPQQRAAMRALVGGRPQAGYLPGSGSGHPGTLDPSPETRRPVGAHRAVQARVRGARRHRARGQLARRESSRVVARVAAHRADVPRPRLERRRDGSGRAARRPDGSRAHARRAAPRSVTAHGRDTPDWPRSTRLRSASPASTPRSPTPAVSSSPRARAARASRHCSHPSTSPIVRPTRHRHVAAIARPRPPVARHEGQQLRLHHRSRAALPTSSTRSAGVYTARERCT